MTSVSARIQANLAEEKRDTAAWVANAFNKALLHDEPLSETIAPFIADGHSEKKLLPNALRAIATWHMRLAMDKSFNGACYPADEITRMGLYKFWYYECAHAIMETEDPAGYKFSMRHFTDVSTMLALGWLNHADRLAQTMFDRWDVQEAGNGAIAWNDLPQYLPWLSVKLHKAWRDSDEDYEHEPDDDALDGFAPLLHTLFDPRPELFADALSKAADFHVLGSGTDDYDPVNDQKFWLFPVELLAACRIRQQRGFELPAFAHPLFGATPLCRFHEPLPMAPDAILAKALPAYAAATGTLKLIV